ncbi:superinfection immunity protein [Paraburkholderia sp. SIMBA_049]
MTTVGALILFVVLYFLPGLIASARKHRNATAIAITNLLFGWTFIGWGIALIWAFKMD